MRWLKKIKTLFKLLIFLLPLFGLLVYTVMRSGPFAPVPVRVHQVTERSITPQRFGIGTVEARYRYAIGPNTPGRLLKMSVDVGDHVTAGAVLGEMDAVDLDQRIAALQAQQRAAAAKLADAEALQSFAKEQRLRYATLSQSGATSRELAELKHREEIAAASAVNIATAEIERLRREELAMQRQRSDFLLSAPVDGLIVARHAEVGSTLVTGEAALEMIDDDHIWIHTRFDQYTAAGIQADQRVKIVLRSRPGISFEGKILRVEPLADSVTEELLAKIVFDKLPDELPPIGELAEVTVSLPETKPLPLIPNAALRRFNNKTGVWLLEEMNKIRFMPISTGDTTLDGLVQVTEGLTAQQTIITHSRKPLNKRSRVKVTDAITGGR